MKRIVAPASVVVFGCAWALGLDAQTRRPSSVKPDAEIVQTVGCAARKDGNPATWWLNRAAEPGGSPPGAFSVAQVDQARKAELGTATFRLVGTADFVTKEELLKSGQRSLFTDEETANASGQLQHGHKVLVKGLLIEDSAEKRINLMSVIDLAETCG